VSNKFRHILWAHSAIGCCSTTNSRGISAPTPSTTTPISHYQWHEVHANGIALPRRSIGTRGRDWLYSLFLGMDHAGLIGHGAQCYYYCTLIHLYINISYRRIAPFCMGDIDHYTPEFGCEGGGVVEFGGVIGAAFCVCECICIYSFRDGRGFESFRVLSSVFS